MAENPWNVSETALGIIDERPLWWPADLFCQVLIDEVDASRHLLSCPPLGTRAKIEPSRMMEWIIGRIEEVYRIVMVGYQTWLCSDFLGFFGGENAQDLTPGKHKVALQYQAGAPAEIIPRIIAISRRLAALYRQAIEWSHSVRNADVHPAFKETTYELSFSADSTLRMIECLGPAIFDALNRRRDSAKAGAPAQTVETLDFDLNAKQPDVDPAVRAFRAGFERLQRGAASADGAGVAGRAGYLYILTNPSLGNTLKIGKTRRNPRDRIDELSSATAIPTPFVLAFDAYVEDCDRAEAYVHARLERDGYRVAKNREFFNLDLATAIAVVLEAQKEERKRNEKQREAQRQREERLREAEARQREEEAQRQRDTDARQREVEAQRRRETEARQREEEAQRQLEEQRRQVQRQREIEASRWREEEAEQRREAQRQWEERKREAQRQWCELKRQARHQGKEASRAVLLGLVVVTRWLARIANRVLRSMARRREAQGRKFFVSVRRFSRRTGGVLRGWASRLEQ